MLRFLAIRHLAVIDQLELEFQPGLNVLTGETGAGKSIVVGAVGLLVGGRASADLVRTGEDAASLEGIFETAEGREIILRREITSQGRSRAFIDGALATSASLRELSGVLVDLHGQHEHQLLLDAVTHLDLLDEFAGLTSMRPALKEAFDAWQGARDDRERLAAIEREAAARLDFVSFQLGEIERVAPVAGEDDELIATRQVLANADKLQRLCADAYDALYEGDNAALRALAIVWKKVGELAAIDDRFEQYAAARESIKPQLEDLSFFLRSYAADIDASPARLQEIEDRLALLERLKKKHGPALSDVLAKRASLKRDLDAIENSAERRVELDRVLDTSRARFLEIAGGVSNRRRAAARQFAAALTDTLGDLAMPRTRCDVRFTMAQAETQWSDRGVESAEFYISPNPGEDLKPLVRIASGGELSRIMLALKTLASTDAPGKTLVFDEVDAGIGGAAADVVGARLRKLSERCQVLCITHLPQIAAHGTTHFSISKSVKGSRTSTQVTRLGAVEREEELARMIGGAEISAAVLAGAREMLALRLAETSPQATGGSEGTSRSRGAKAKQRQKAKGESTRDVT